MEAAPEASEAALGIEYLNKGITVIKKENDYHLRFS